MDQTPQSAAKADNLIFHERQILVVVPQELEVNTVPPNYELELLDSAVLSSIGKQVLLLTWSDDRRPLEVVGQLELDPSLSRAQFNYLYRPLAARHGTTFADDDFAAQMLQVEELHRHAQGGNVPIALIDTPVDKRHRAFARARIENVSVIRDPADFGMHSTAVASGIVAADVVTGMAPDAQLLVFSAMSDDRKAAGWVAGDSFLMAKALDVAYNRMVRVIDIAMGSENGKKDEIVNQIIDAAVQRGAIVVAAAGNAGPNGRRAYPAALDDVIAVTAVDRDKQLYSQASTGPYISLAAPGVDVLVAGPNDQFVKATGSSLASAFVSGIVALVLEKRPDFQTRQVRKLLEDTAEDLGDLGKDDRYGAGLVSGVKALQQLEVASSRAR